MPGKPGQYVKCRHCSSDLHWRGTKPFKSRADAETPIDPLFIVAEEPKPPPVPSSNDAKLFPPGPFFSSVAWIERPPLSTEVKAAFENASSSRLVVKATEINAFDSEALAQHAGTIYLEGLTTITPEVAAALARRKGRLCLGLTTISPEVAKALVKHRGHLCLDVTTLPPAIAKAFPLAVAEVFTKHLGDMDFIGLRTISLDVAKALAKYEGKMYLVVLNTLTPNVAGALAKHRGGLSIH